MEKYTAVFESIDSGSAIFYLQDITWKRVIELLSELISQNINISYRLTLEPTLLSDTTDAYDVDTFATIIQEYIEHLQSQNPNVPFRLIIQRKYITNDEVFYTRAWELLGNYADRIVLKSSANTMILTCE